VISVVDHVLPSGMHQLTELCRQDHFREAGALQQKLRKLTDALFCEVNPIPVKTALQLMGWEVGPLRLPLCPMGESHLLQLKEALEEWVLL
ncbi:MAG: dihydrodipicolinate synthase family protein, partial [Oscillospiraceae bacterium]|nr:dihydrodipicolinate synthase family protein [Oscillospiraceae bacterium]